MAAPMRCLSVIQKYSSQCLKTMLRSERQLISCPIINVSAKRSREFHCHSVSFQKTPPDPMVLKKLMENLTDKFTEARELLEDARESQGTVYFTDDMEDAQTAVKETLQEYEQLLDALTDTQRKEVIATLGLRMQELKAQQAAIEDSLKD